MYVRDLTPSDYARPTAVAGGWQKKGFKYALVQGGYIWDVFKTRREAQDAKVRMTEEREVPSLREKLAKLEHDQWAHWTLYMLKRLDLLSPEGRAKLTPSQQKEVSKWIRQAKTHYEDLNASEQDSDREWADKAMTLFSQG